MKLPHHFSVNQQSILILFFSAIFFCLSGCTKEKFSEFNIPKDEVVASGAAFSSLLADPTFCKEDYEDVNTADSVLKPTLLGSRLNGYPYSVSAMQQAALQILGTSTGVAVNAW